jgi:hypothetical protein
VLTENGAPATETLARRLRRESLGLRLIAVTMRTALRDVDNSHPPDQRAQWAADLAWWADGVIDYHRRRIELMREELASVEGRGSSGELTTLFIELDAAMAEAFATAKAARRRVSARKRHSQP